MVDAGSGAPSHQTALSPHTSDGVVVTQAKGKFSQVVFLTSHLPVTSLSRELHSSNTNTSHIHSDTYNTQLNNGYPFDEATTLNSTLILFPF